MRRALAALLLAAPAGVAAQVPADTAVWRPFWVDVGLGVTTPGRLALAGSAIAEFRPGRVAGARAMLSEELCIFGCRSPDRLVEVGALYGWTAGGRYTAATIALGAALVTGRRTDHAHIGPAEQRRFTTVGLPVQLQLQLRPFRHVGVALTGIANVNPETPIAGALIGIQLGRLSTP